MNKGILEFLEAYKRLDELCKQILSSDRGISEYIDEMDNEWQGYLKVSSWENDYKQLKKMRWIRNRLVHEAGSFQDNLYTIEDIDWLETFYSRILECKDPFSLLHQSRNIIKPITKHEKSLEPHLQTSQPSWNLRMICAIILIGITILTIVFFFLILMILCMIK